MIFVTLGSQDKPFPRLINEIDLLIRNRIINEEVIAQIGPTKYDGELINAFKMCNDFKAFQNYIDRADLIITHGGVGSIIDAISHGKKVIAIPRLKRYKESANDHQEQIIKKLNDEKYIIGIYNIKDLGEAIKYSKDFKPKKYVKDNRKILKIIEDYIDNN
jgi:UDP-N-acetylglucosamine transferase subunit ALG13